MLNGLVVLSGAGSGAWLDLVVPVPDAQLLDQVMPEQRADGARAAVDLDLGPVLAVGRRAVFGDVAAG